MSTRLRLSRFASAPALALAILLSSTSAFARNNCTQQAFSCMDSASQLSTFWERAAAGIDCGLNYAACVRGVLGI